MNAFQTAKASTKITLANLFEIGHLIFANLAIFAFELDVFKF
jgi:hypothetical protein